MILKSLIGLGKVLTATGKPNEAEPFLREALDGYRKKMPAGHWSSAEAESVLGACLAAQGRFLDAEPLLLQSYQILENASGATATGRKRQAAERIIKLYDAWSKPEKSAAWRKKLEATLDIQKGIANNPPLQPPR